MSDAMAVIIGAVIGGFFAVAGNVVTQLIEMVREERKFKRDNASATAAKSVLQEMLNNRKYTDRTLSALKQRIGGYTDDELRKFLLEVGAQRSGRSDDEWWYLKSRLPERRENAQKRQMARDARRRI